MDEKETQDLIDAFKKHIESIGGDFDKLRQNLKLNLKDEKAVRQHLASLGLALDKTAREWRKSGKEIEDSIQKYKKQIKDGTLTVEELSDYLEVLRKDINRTSDQSKKSLLMQQKADLERINLENVRSKAFKEASGSLVGILAGGLAKSFTSAARTAMSTGDALETAGAFMTGQIDMMNQGAQAGATALQQVGAAGMAAGGTFRLAGIAASIAGEALSFLGNQVSELAKAGISFMISQTKKLVDGFTQLSNAGAIYAGGMMEQISTAHSAGLTMDQFSKAVSNNSSLLSKTGLGVGEASKKMSAAMAAGGKSAREGMFALGMSMEQQADAYAQTMSIMAGPTGKLKASNEEVAAATAAYAQNLKIVSAISGEDAKAKQDKLRQENDTLQFNQKLAAMSGPQREALNAAMMNMNESQQRALRERMVYGTLISKDLAIAEATNSGARKANEAFYNAVQDGSISAEKARQIQAANADETRKAALEQTALAMSQSEGAVASSKVQNDFLKTANQNTEEARKAAEEAIKKRQADGAKGKGGPEVDVMQMQQDFAVKIEDIARNNLPKFATALTETMSQIEKAVASLANLGAETPGMLGGILSGVISTILLGVLPPLIKGMLSAKGAGTGFGDIGTGGGGGGSPKGSGGGGLRKNSAGQWINEKGQFVSKAEAAAAEESGMLSKAGGMLGKAGKYAGRIGGVVAVGSALYEGYQGYNAAKEAEKSGAMTHQQADAAKGKAVGGATGGAAGGVGGAYLGAAIGTMIFPGVGTVIGGLLGGLAGGGLGEAAGGFLGEHAVGAPSPKKQPTPGAAVPATQAELHEQAEEFSKAVGNPVPTKTENDSVVAALHLNNKLLHDIASTLDMQKKYTSQLVQLSA